MTGSASRLLRVVAFSLATLAAALTASAQVVATAPPGAPAQAATGIRGVILDQSGLPIPGASVQLLDGATEVAATTSGPDGTYVLAAAGGTSLVVTLEGFETKTVATNAADKIV